MLIPDKAEITRDDLEKLSHWDELDEADLPCLAILTDSFGRFIGLGYDVSILTVWHGGTPTAMQIDGRPCELALDAVTDVICGNAEELVDIGYDDEPLPPDPIQEKLAKLAEKVEREAEARHAKADNDNQPLLVRLRRMYGGEIIGERIYRAKVPPSNLAASIIGVIDGEPWTFTPGGEPFARLPPLTKPISATPFSLRDPATLPERDWLFAQHYIRRYLTATVGAGGGGKSAHAVSEVLAMVTGRPLLDADGALTKPLRVWYINVEDPQDEIDRRFHAAAKHFGVTAEQIGDRLYTDSGRDQEFVIMRQEGRDLKVCQPLIDEMVAEIERREIDVVIIDPLVSTHEVPENDNGAMQRVAKAWTEVADRAKCGVEVIHHIVKNAGEATADSARGGGALKDKTRGMRVINPMTATEAAKLGFDSPDGYFRIDHGKINLVASGRSQWRRFESVPLGNGKGMLSQGDNIGVVEPWRWPSADCMAERAAEARRAIVADVPEDLLAGLKVRLDASNHKSDPKGKPWAGDLVMELTGTTDRKAAKSMLDAWIESGEFEVVELYDEAARKPRNFVKPMFAPT